MSQEQTRGRLDAGRALRTSTCAGWAGFFGYLWASGEVTRYLGPRTQWVVVFGTIALALATLGQLRFLRTNEHRPLKAGQALGHLLAVVPLTVVFIAPEADLGALAASRKLVGEQSRGPVVIPEDREGKALSFIDLELSSGYAEYAKAVGIREGRDIELIGFVSKTSDDGFDLTRFYISCCAADAIPYSVHVVDDADRSFARDTWLNVEGTIEQRQSGTYVIQATDIEETTEPDPPYLY